MLPERSQVHLLFQECWMRLNREGHTQACQKIRETGCAYVSLFAEKHIGSPFVKKDLMDASSMVDAMMAITLYEHILRHPDAGRDGVYEYFCKTPFERLVEHGTTLYRQVVGDPSETDWSTDASFVNQFAQMYPVFLRVRQDIETLGRIAGALGFSKSDAHRSIIDAIIDTSEDDKTLARALRSIMAGAAIGFDKPWLALYPDGMLRILRTLYLAQSDGGKPPYVRQDQSDAWFVGYLSGLKSSTSLTNHDLDLLKLCLRDAVFELQRLWDDPEYLASTLACPGDESGFATGKHAFFWAAFFDASQMSHEGDLCGGTREWDGATFCKPVWTTLLGKASGVPFDGDEEDDDALMAYTRDRCAGAREQTIQWDLAASFLLTDAPWSPVQREHFTLILDTLKRVMAVIQEHGCEEDSIRATLAVLDRLEYGPQAQD